MKGLSLKFALVTVLLFFASTIYQFYSERIDRSFMPGEIVNIDEHEFHLLCRGEGSPVVILENGNWGSHPDWLDVIDGVSRSTKVCSYDRLGMGWSSKNNKASRAQDIAVNLNKLLAAADISGPTILVGFSAGGLYVRHYTGLYPENIVGMVLVDSSHEQQVLRMTHIPQNLSLVNLCSYISWAGIPRVFGLLESDVPESYSQERATEQLRIYNRTQFCHGLKMQSIGLPLDQVSSLPPKSLGELPLIVISAGKTFREQIEIPEELDEFAEEHERMWPVFQGELAALSTRSEHWIAEKSGHSIPTEQPGIIVDAIYKMLVTYRAE